MLEKLKTWWDKFKLWIGAGLAALALLFLVFKKSPTVGLGDYLKDESQAKKENETKLEQGTAEIKKEEQKEIKKAEEEKNDKLKEAEESAEKKKSELTELEKKDEDAFKQEVNKELGVKEGKQKKKKRNRKRR
jgi:hypothetical protein